ncbi:MAG: toll/interleukin-1 receptor domain-containing protein [Acidobacteriota bacterium]
MLRILISYSWKNMLLRVALVHIIEENGFKAVWDEREIPPGENLNEGIIIMLNSSDAVIACLTEDSLKSKAVLEELTRAHHQGLRIYAVVHSSVATNLPWFLRETVYLSYETEEQLTATFKKLVRETIQNDAELLKAGRIHSIIQKLHRTATKMLDRNRFGTSEGKWSHELATAVLKNASDELKSLSISHYKAIVSKGANFLMRAKPVFERASQVYAVSLDTVSSFWVSDENHDQALAKSYLSTQPTNTMRLFVFSTPDSAQNYANVLNNHAARYGADGRVFICTKAAYQEIVRAADDDKELFNCDFAVLEYKNLGHLSDLNDPIIYEATLDRKFFKVERVNNRHLLPVGEETEMRCVFDDLKKLDVGEIHPRNKVMRWKMYLERSKDEWAAKLHELFPQMDRDFLHFVLFTREAIHNNSAELRLRECVHKIQCAVAKFAEDKNPKIRVKDVWFGESSIVPAFDGRTGGRLISDESRHFPYLLFIRFENQHSLEEWYRFPEHFDMRRSLFEAFDPTLRSLFTAIDEIQSSNQEGVRTVASIYEEIERRAAAFIKRLDYSDTDTIRDIVDREPFSPSR